MYRYINKEHTQVFGNGKTIPADYRVYQEEILPWVALGNTIAPFAEPIVPPEVLLKTQRDIDLMSVVVEINGDAIKANPTEQQNLEGRQRQMTLDSQATCKWRQDGVSYVLTIADFQTILDSGTKQCAAIYDVWIEALEALEAL
jgi:hypothetical protein